MFTRRALTWITILALLCQPHCVRANTSLTYRLGTLGFGLGVDHALNEQLTLRLGYNLFIRGKSFSTQGVNLDATLRIMAGSLIVDWHIPDSAWRLSVGASQTGPIAKLKGTATGSVTFNGQTYNASDFGDLRAELRAPSRVGTYLGVGYGRSVGHADRFEFLADLGAIHSGAPRAFVSARCDDLLAATQCTQLMSDIQAEAAQQEQQFRHLNWWPVLSLGFSLRW